MTGGVGALIAWDVDDVLNALTREWLAWFARDRGATLPYAALRENPPHDVLGIAHAEYLASLDAFRREAYETLAPSPAVLAWLAAHGDAAEHIAVTAVPLRAAHLSAAWVLRHFGRWIRGVHVVPSPRPDDPVALPRPDKGSALARFRGPIILVDDSPLQVSSARARGLRAVTFPQPWNDAPASVDAALRDLADLADLAHRTNPP